MDEALQLVENATQPRETVQTNLVWDASGAWKANYMHVGPDNIDALRAAGDARRAEQAATKERVSSSAG